MSSSDKLLKEMQKIASNAQIQVQKLVNQGNKDSFNFNAKEASTARQWQKEMSDTSHQREVKDLQKAGLNPVLSAGGNGAQSYTTSSASDHAENAASAVTQLYGTRMQGMVSKYQADTSAAAQRAAAAQQAAAQKYAAQMNLKAAQEAAAAQRYASDRNYDIQKQKMMNDRWLALNKQPSSIAGFADKYIGQYLSKADIKDTARYGNSIGASDFGNKGKITANNFVLKRSGEKIANQGLYRLGLPQNAANRRLFVQAFTFGDSSAMAAIARQVANYKKASRGGSAAWYRGSHGVW